MAEPDDSNSVTSGEPLPIVTNGCPEAEDAKQTAAVDDSPNAAPPSEVNDCAETNSNLTGTNSNLTRTNSNHEDETTEEVDSHTPTLDPVPEQNEDSQTANEDKNEESASVGSLVDGQEDDDPASNSKFQEGDEAMDVQEDDDEPMEHISSVVVNEDASPESSEASPSSNPLQSIDNDATKDDKQAANDEETNSVEESNSVEDNDEEVQFVPDDVQEVHDISDSEEDDDRTPTRQDVEHMEVDSGIKTNGHTTDKTYDIDSGSDDDTERPATNRRTHASEAEEDCVVIEDDEERDEVITADPLSQPMKKQKTEMGFTIQDARSLAVDPLATSSPSLQSHTKEDNSQAEPSMTIVDTNSIMNRSTVQALQGQNISVHPVGKTPNSPSTYPANTRATITPVTPKQTANNTPQNAAANFALSPSAAAQLLPALTDDMFVLEAPSFIVPYIYEKPPVDTLREIVETIRKELAEQKKQEDVELDEKEAKELEAMSEEQRKLAELARAADANKKKSASKKSASKKRTKSGDDSWNESDTSTDDETSDTEAGNKVLIKEANTDLDAIKMDGTIVGNGSAMKTENYFESPLGKFFIDIAVNLVQEHVQTDLLRQQKKRLRREGESAASSVEMAITSLTKNLEHSKLKNKMFKFETKRCEFCNFKTESTFAMAHHYEAPHLVGQMYKCNFCEFEARPPYDILFHMEAIHNIKARLDKAQTYHQCPNCPFEDNGKSKLARHAVVCVKKFRPEVNLNPPLDWEPPAKIPRIKPRHGLVGTATAYQAMAAQAQRSATNALQLQQQRQNAALNVPNRGRGRPATNIHMVRGNLPPQPMQLNRSLPGVGIANNSFQMNANGQFVQVPSPRSSKSQQPSISITPLPCPPGANNAMATAQAMAAASNLTHMKPGQQPPPGKSAFVICEICDGYIKDLDQLRHHMQWIHEVKIHPKMIYNRPPLNCQKCQFRFFTDQGLERHLLGSHGLVTSSMQEAANKGKDSGRCPICGRFFQSKLLNHVSRDHIMTLKPAHLSYKCTVCTATFGMYKQFENHVYSAHSNVAKKAMDVKSKGATPTGSGKSASSSGSNSTAGDSLLKPIKINDEITIIPQPTASSRQSRGAKGVGSNAKMDNNVIEIL